MYYCVASHINDRTADYSVQSCLIRQVLFIGQCPVSRNDTKEENTQRYATPTCHSSLQDHKHLETTLGINKQDDSDCTEPLTIPKLEKASEIKYMFAAESAPRSHRLKARVLCHLRPRYIQNEKERVITGQYHQLNIR